MRQCNAPVLNSEVFFFCHDVNDLCSSPFGYSCCRFVPGMLERLVLDLHSRNKVVRGAVVTIGRRPWHGHMACMPCRMNKSPVSCLSYQTGENKSENKRTVTPMHCLAKPLTATAMEVPSATHALRMHHLVPACALHGHVQRHAANACSCPLHARWVIRLQMSATTTACKEYLSSQSIVTVTSEATASRATPGGSLRLHAHHSIALTMRGWHAQK